MTGGDARIERQSELTHSPTLTPHPQDWSQTCLDLEGSHGFIFSASRGTKVSFDLRVNGVPAPAKQIHLGRPSSKAASNPFSENR
jgi:hypothetical protein